MTDQSEIEKLLAALKPFGDYLTKQETKLAQRGGNVAMMPTNKTLHSIPLAAWKVAQEITRE